MEAAATTAIQNNTPPNVTSDVSNPRPGMVNTLTQNPTPVRKRKAAPIK
jgi:hypothetical protein